MARKQKNGFTLAELLVVVAIIAILVGIAIPVFRANLEKARETVDIANMRSARGAFSIAYLGGEILAGSDTALYYDGSVFSESRPQHGYGQGTAADGKSTYSVGNGCELCNYNSIDDHSGELLVASVGSDGTVHIHWVNAHLSVQSALILLDPNWTTWGITDSKGFAGVKTRQDVLKALGLSDNHEYSFYNPKDGSGLYTVYVYSGTFPDPSSNGTSENMKKINEWLNKGNSKPITVSVYTYDPNTYTTEYKGQQSAKAALRNNGSGYWIQIQPVK